MDYFSANDLDPEEIEAAFSHGTLEVWRKDPAGVQWYRRAATFHTMAGIPDDLDEGDDIEAEASECSQAVRSGDYLDDFTDDVAPNVWRKVL